jgi:MFS family permease
MMLALALTNVINAIYARDVLGIPQSQWYLVYIPMLIVMIIASYPVGKLVDKVGTKLPLAVGPILLAASTLLFVGGNLISITVSMCLLGLVTLFTMSSAMALSASLVEPTKRGKVTGGVNFIGYILTGLGMLLGSFLYNLMPQTPFFLTIALVIPISLIIVFKIREPKTEDRKY